MRKASIIALILGASAVIAEQDPSSAQSLGNTADPQFRVLSPWAEADPITPRGISPRLKSLTGKRIGLFANFKRASRPIVAEMGKRLKELPETHDVPVIFLSALTSVEDKVKAFQAGGVDYITKPFQAREVIVRVTTHLTLRRLQNELLVVNRELAQRNLDLEMRNAELQDALDTINSLSGLIPICAWCGRKIENESGEWVALERYIEDHSEASFTHGMCPDCLEQARRESRQSLWARRDVSDRP